MKAQPYDSAPCWLSCTLPYKFAIKEQIPLS
jgi:hypothetical protein